MAASGGFTVRVPVYLNGNEIASAMAVDIDRGGPLGQAVRSSTG